MNTIILLVVVACIACSIFALAKALEVVTRKEKKFVPYGSVYPINIAFSLIFTCRFLIFLSKTVASYDIVSKLSFLSKYADKIQVIENKIAVLGGWTLLLSLMFVSLAIWVICSCLIRAFTGYSVISPRKIIWLGILAYAMSQMSNGGSEYRILFFSALIGWIACLIYEKIKKCIKNARTETESAKRAAEESSNAGIKNKTIELCD